MGSVFNQIIFFILRQKAINDLTQRLFSLKNDVGLKETTIQYLNEEITYKNRELEEKGNEVDKIDFHLSWVYAILASQIMGKCQLQEKKENDISLCSLSKD